MFPYFFRYCKDFQKTHESLENSKQKPCPLVFSLITKVTWPSRIFSFRVLYLVAIIFSKRLLLASPQVFSKQMGFVILDFPQRKSLNYIVKNTILFLTVWMYIPKKAWRTIRPHQLPNSWRLRLGEAPVFFKLRSTDYSLWGESQLRSS